MSACVHGSTFTHKTHNFSFPNILFLPYSENTREQNTVNPVVTLVIFECKRHNACDNGLTAEGKHSTRPDG